MSSSTKYVLKNLSTELQEKKILKTNNVFRKFCVGLHELLSLTACDSIWSGGGGHGLEMPAKI